MDYQHHIFISYKRERHWTPWVRDHFKELLSSYLHQDLAVERPDIFVDERIDVGADWVDELAEHLATSAVMVAIFSADYFASDWCIHELDLMLGRSPPGRLVTRSSCTMVISSPSKSAGCNLPISRRTGSPASVTERRFTSSSQKQCVRFHRGWRPQFAPLPVVMQVGWPLTKPGSMPFLTRTPKAAPARRRLNSS